MPIIKRKTPRRKTPRRKTRNSKMSRRRSSNRRTMRRRRKFRGGNGFSDFSNASGVVSSFGSAFGANQATSALTGSYYMQPSPAYQPTGSVFYKPMI